MILDPLLHSSYWIIMSEKFFHCATHTHTYIHTHTRARARARVRV